MRRILSLLYTLIFIICIYPHPANSVDGMQFMYNCPLCSDSSQSCNLTGLPPSCALTNPENGVYKPCCLYSNGTCNFDRNNCKLECNLGYYAPGSSCEICPAGSYCPSGATLATKCPAGQYSDEGASTCTACPAPYTTGAAGTGKTINGCSVFLKQGEYVSNGKVTTCPAGYYCLGGTTYYDNNGATECPAGSYCPAGKSEPIQCPTDAPYSRAGAKSADECFSCSPGTYRDETVTECTTCPVGHYCENGQKKECPAGRYNDQTGQSSCQKCPGGTYNAKTGQTQCTECPDINDHMATKYPAGWYASEGDIKINSANNPKWDSLSGKTTATECVGSYNVSGPRGKFTHEAVGYNSDSEKYDNFEVGVLYYWAPNPGFYLTEKLSDTYCAMGGINMYYRDSKACEAGKYCPGRTGTTSCSSGQYKDTLGQDGNIAPGYFSTGGATSAQPNSTTPTNGGTGCIQSTECPDGGCHCGYVAPGHYSTGGGTLFSPSGPGNGCLDGFDCGAIAAGYYSTGGAPSKIPANCVSGGECGILIGGRFATCGAKTSEPTNNDHCATGCFCGFTSPGYYSTGGGTLYEPKGVGNGCLDGYECGPCDQKNEFCPRGSSSKHACAAGKYCQISSTDDTKLITKNCPVGTTSNAGSTEIADCFIDSNTKFCVTNKDDKCFNLHLPDNTKINLKSAKKI